MLISRLRPTNAQAAAPVLHDFPKSRTVPVQHPLLEGSGCRDMGPGLDYRPSFSTSRTLRDDPGRRSHPRAALIAECPVQGTTRFPSFIILIRTSVVLFFFQNLSEMPARGPEKAGTLAEEWSGSRTESVSEGPRWSVSREGPSLTLVYCNYPLPARHLAGGPDEPEASATVPVRA
jgi:hypothetical protein